MASDAGSVFLTGLLTKIVYLDLILATDQSSLPHLLASIALAAVLVMFYERMDLYRNETIASPLVGFGKVWGGLAIAFLVTLGLLYALKIAENYSRVWFFTWFVVAAIAIVYARSRCLLLLRSRIGSGQLRSRIALIGTSAQVSSMEAHLASTRALNSASTLGKVGGKFLVGDIQNAPALDGGLCELQSAMARAEFDQVIICIPSNERQLLRATAIGLSSYSAEVLLCSDMSEYPVAIRESRAIDRIRMDVVNAVPDSEHSQFAKRLLDCTLATIGLALLAPLFALVAIAIKLDSPGPVFFRQRRYGKNNTIFRIFKFRSMTVAEDGSVVRQAQRHDPRVTRVGRILRRTSIDELPQLINVLLGEMSIVGPRPHAIAHDDAFERQHDLFARRRRVRPGITGWAQVNGFRGETPTSDLVRQRMDCDIYYIDNWSIWLDLEIIIRTIMVVGRGAY